MGFKMGFRGWVIAASIVAAPLQTFLPDDFTTDAAESVAVAVAPVAYSTSGPEVIVSDNEWLTLDVEEGHNAPSALVAALADDKRVWSDPADGAERFYAPLGAWFPVAGGGFLATDAGWWGCTDHVSAPEYNGGICTPGGAVEPVPGLSWVPVAD
jgi:hypothetical protein